MPTRGIPEDLIADVHAHLFPVLRGCLDAAQERHRVAEGQGASHWTFGSDAWGLPAERFRELAEAGEIPFAPAPEGIGALVWHGTRVRHHRVGWSEQDDIRQCFPKRGKALGFEAARQLSFDFGDAFVGDEAGTIVLAFMANPTDGLAAAYLCTVGEVRNRRVVAWDKVVTLWRRGVVETPGPLFAARVPPERIPEPTVRRRPVREDADAEGR
ncbi:MAG: hypothetical protein KC466_04605 [Myxococcales bacterium]|nr:hypothetical protein [Myxococcales bacterium]